jgi:hypothetical protein
MNRTLPLTSIAALFKSLNAQQILASVWSGVKMRMVSIMNEHLGLAGAALTGSFIFGMTIVTAIDRYYPVKRDPQDRCKLLLQAEIATLAIAGSTIFSLVDRINSKAVIIFFSLATGVILGVQTKKYYDRNNDQKINEFVEEIKQNLKFNENDRLNLSSYVGSLRYFNLAKLGKKINESFKPGSLWSCRTLILRNCQMEDSDLRQLGDADWFSYFQKVDLSDNTRLTHSGLKQIAKAAGDKLEILDLSRIDLTDSDLEQMACSGYFRHLKVLILRVNPRLTGKGMAWIAERGFESLQSLDLTGNSQVLKIGLNDWLEKDGLKNLEVLDLSATDITENELWQMIEKADWFRKLKGVNISCCTHLKKFPSNILRLTHLDDHGVSSSVLLSSGRIYYHNKGLFFRACSNLAYTQELLKLVKDGKAFGGKENDEGLLQKAGRELDLPKMCEIFKAPFKEEN